MSKYGLTEERYNQLLALYRDDGEVAEKVEDWGVENCNKGMKSLTLMELECWK